MRKGLTAIVLGLSLLAPSIAGGMLKTSERPEDGSALIVEEPQTYFGRISDVIFRYSGQIIEHRVNRDFEKVELARQDLEAEIVPIIKEYLISNEINISGGLVLQCQDHLLHTERLLVDVHQEEPGDVYHGCPVRGRVRLVIYPVDEAIEVYCPTARKSIIPAGVLHLITP